MARLSEISRSTDQSDQAHDITALHTNAAIEHQRTHAHDYVILIGDGVEHEFTGTSAQRLKHLTEELQLSVENDQWAAAHWSERTGRWQVCGTSLELRKQLMTRRRPLNEIARHNC